MLCLIIFLCKVKNLLEVLIYFCVVLYFFKELFNRLIFMSLVLKNLFFNLLWYRKLK